MAFAVYQRCAGQLIFSGMGDPVDINVLAVRCIMELEELPHQAETMEKVQLLARTVLGEQARERERRREREEKRGR